MNEVERQRAHFESISETYLAARRERNHLRLKELLWRHALAGHAALQAPSLRVLEPMCGYGEGKKLLEGNRAAPIQYTGFDFSRTLVEQAKAYYPGAKIFLADVTQFQATETYDVVILIGGLHHVYARAGDVLRR